MLDNINADSSVPVYVQIENLVQFGIASGELKSGDRLPSVREFSERLKVNPNTVAKAFRDLEVMGLLYTRRGMGFFIEKGVADKCREHCQRKIASRLHEVVAEAKSAGMAPAKIENIVRRCLASETGPYGATPDSILDFARNT